MLLDHGQCLLLAVRHEAGHTLGNVVSRARVSWAMWRSDSDTRGGSSSSMGERMSTVRLEL